MSSRFSDVDAQAALTKLDDSMVTGFHRRVLLTAGMGFFTDAYDLFIIGVALALIEVEWHPSVFEVSMVASTALVASAFGAVMFGWLADRLGRSRIYGFEALLLALGTIACALSPNLWWLIVFRFIVGFGIGGDYPVSATIMSEYSARDSRGRMVAMVFSMQALGLIVGPLVAACLLATGISHEVVWRIMLGLGAIPALAVFQLRRKMQETPRFAMAAGDADYAVRSARLAAGQTKKQRSSGPLRVHNAASNNFRALFLSRKLRRYLLGSAGAWFLLDFAFYGNTISSPAILKLISPHASLIRTTLETLAIFVVAAAPGYLLAIRKIDTQGRKSIQSVGFAVMALCFLAIGLIPDVTGMLLPFLALYGLSYFFMQYGPNTTTFIYPTELFPVRSRASGHGIAAACGKAGAFIGTFLFPYLLTSFGLARTELVAGLVCLGGLVVTLWLLPETKGQSLEATSAELPAAGLPLAAPQVLPAAEK